MGRFGQSSIGKLVIVGESLHILMSEYRIKQTESAYHRGGYGGEVEPYFETVGWFAESVNLSSVTFATVNEADAVSVFAVDKPVKGVFAGCVEVNVVAWYETSFGAKVWVCFDKYGTPIMTPQDAGRLQMAVAPSMTGELAHVSKQWVNKVKGE